MSKSDFTFAPSIRIDYLMTQFQKKFLARYTPCHYTNIDELAHAQGIIHVEFILVHPFREGNGRVARLLADLMAMQAKRPPINYAAVDQTQNSDGFNHYILAIHAGVEENYSPIQNIFKKLLEDSI